MMHVTKTTIKDIEKENLEAHVELCAQRYAVLEKRLTVLEDEVGNLKKAAESARASMWKAIGVSTGIISAVVSITLIILERVT